MKLTTLLSACVLSLSLLACNEQPKTETVVEAPAPASEPQEVKVVVEQPKTETKVVVVEKEEEPAKKSTEIKLGSEGASLKTNKVDIEINK